MAENDFLVAEALRRRMAQEGLLGSMFQPSEGATMGDLQAALPPGMDSEDLIGAVLPESSLVAGGDASRFAQSPTMAEYSAVANADPAGADLLRAKIRALWDMDVEPTGQALEQRNRVPTAIQVSDEISRIWGGIESGQIPKDLGMRQLFGLGAIGGTEAGHPYREALEGQRARNAKELELLRQAGRRGLIADKDRNTALLRMLLEVMGNIPIMNAMDAAGVNQWFTNSPEIVLGMVQRFLPTLTREELGLAVGELFSVAAPGRAQSGAKSGGNRQAPTQRDLDEEAAIRSLAEAFSDELQGGQ